MQFPNSLGPIDPEKSQVAESKSDIIIANLHDLLKKEKDLGRDEALTELSNAFAELKSIDPKMSVYPQIFFAILGRYGMRLYPQFEAARSLLEASLQLHLHQHGFFEAASFDHLSTLAEFQKIPEDSFKNLRERLKQYDENQFVKFTERLNEAEKFEFAQTLSTLCGIYSNLEAKCMDMEKGTFLDFLTRLVNGIHLIYLSMEQTPSVKEQLGELHYHNFPGLFLEQCELKNDGKVSEEELFASFDLLDKALKFNSSEPMKARIANLKGCNVFSYLGDIQRAKQFLFESHELWGKCLKESHLAPAEQEKFGFLFATVNSSCIALLIKSESKDLEEMERYALVAREFFEKTKEKHPYSLIFALNLARLEELKGNKKEALRYLDELIKISGNYSTWPDTKGYLEKAEALKQKLQ